LNSSAAELASHPGTPKPAIGEEIVSLRLLIAKARKEENDAGRQYDNLRWNRKDLELQLRNKEREKCEEEERK
jgi:hypothetical protein